MDQSQSRSTPWSACGLLIEQLPLCSTEYLPSFCPSNRNQTEHVCHPRSHLECGRGGRGFCFPFVSIGRILFLCCKIDRQIRCTPMNHCLGEGDVLKRLIRQRQRRERRRRDDGGDLHKVPTTKMCTWSNISYAHKNDTQKRHTK